MRLDVRIVHRDTPADLAGAVDGRVVPGAAGDLPEALADGRKVDVRGGGVPPGRGFEARVQVLDLVPGEEGAPDGGACELYFVVWPRCVADDLCVIAMIRVAILENLEYESKACQLTDRIPSAPTTRSAVAVVPSLK